MLRQRFSVCPRPLVLSPGTSEQSPTLHSVPTPQAFPPLLRFPPEPFPTAAERGRPSTARRATGAGPGPAPALSQARTARARRRLQSCGRAAPAPLRHLPRGLSSPPRWDDPRRPLRCPPAPQPPWGALQPLRGRSRGSRRSRGRRSPTAAGPGRAAQQDVTSPPAGGALAPPGARARAAAVPGDGGRRRARPAERGEYGARPWVRPFPCPRAHPSPLRGSTLAPPGGWCASTCPRGETFPRGSRRRSPHEGGGRWGSLAGARGSAESRPSPAAGPRDSAGGCWVPRDAGGKCWGGNCWRLKNIELKKKKSAK